MTSVIPNTGCIRVNELLLAIDKCIDEVLSLLRQSAAKQNSSFQIVGVGLSTFAMNLIGVDVFGEPVGESATLSYDCNREEVVMECQSLKSDLGPERLDAFHQRTGAPIHASYAMPQLLAFYANKNNLSAIKQIDRWQTISSTCLHRWSGKPHFRMPISFSEASWTGMLNFRACHWDDEVVDILDRCREAIPRPDDDEDFFEDDIDLLPPLVDHDAALPFLRNGIPQYCDDGSKNSYWDRWPEFRSRTVSLFLGVGDGAAVNMGSKCGGCSSSTSHRIAVTLGTTSAAARVCLPLSINEVSPPGSDIFVPPGLFCYRVDRHRVLLGGALTDGGSTLEWAQSLFDLQSPEAFDACIDQVSQLYQKRCTLTDSTSASLSSHLPAIPVLSDGRSSGFTSRARACVSGTTQETASVDIIYACLESLTQRLGYVLKLINACNPQQIEDERSSQGIIVASGSPLDRTSSLWQQMLADCSSMDVVMDGDSSDAVNRGVAILMAGSMQQRPGHFHQCPFSADEPLVPTQ
ncbi:hypothetical protein ACHAXR_003321, partial [Thalassiosira sp. AJA248-18]